MDPLLTTDSLSPKRYEDSRIGTPRYCSICLRPAICWMAVRAAANSDPCVAVSTVSCFFVNQSIGVWFRMQCNSLITRFNLRLKIVPMCQKTTKLFSGAKHHLRPANQPGQSRWGAQGRLPLSDLVDLAKPSQPRLVPWHPWERVPPPAGSGGPTRESFSCFDVFSSLNPLDGGTSAEKASQK